MFKVVWQEDATAELQELYFTADPSTRLQISNSLLEIEAALSQIPREVGESRTNDNDRLAFFTCLAVRYDVVVGEDEVRINWVYLCNFN